MIVFAIPLRAKNSCKNWFSVERNFNATIRSIFAQKGSDSFKCIVACNDIPNLSEEYDERLEFIKLDMPIPHTWIEMARDKLWKLTEIAVQVRAILEEQEHPENGIYVMPVDADDFLNCKIAKWCEENPNENGAVSKDGYVWNGKSNVMLIYPEMHKFCGSCNIIKMYREDLPEKIYTDISRCHEREATVFLRDRYPICFDHNEVVDKYKKIGRPFVQLPFRSTVYLRETGDNISSIAPCNANYQKKRFHPVAFLRKLYLFQYKLITKRVREDFTIV